MRSKADQFDTDLVDLAQQAKALSHPARLRILQILADVNACICGEIVDQLPLAQASVSRHLKTLREAGLVQGTIDGPRTCYCIDVEAVERLQAAMDAYFGDLTANLTPMGADTDCC